MNRPLHLALAALIALVATTHAEPAAAQSWPALTSPPAVTQTGANDVAVIVSIEDYAFLPDIPNASRNAAEWETFLRRGLGVENVLTLTNQQAVREQILDFAARATTDANETSTVWFIFIGHGGPAPGGDDGLLIGADGQQNVASMAARGVLQQEVLDILQRGAQQRTVVLLDACFSGRSPAGDALATGTMPVLAVTADPTLASSTVVMTAASADQFAGDLPGVSRPAFSYLVLGALRGWGDDGDGVVTAAEATAFARRELMAIPGRTQTPQLAGDASLALSYGVTEARPATTSAFAPTVDARRATTAPSSSQPDGKADSMLFAHIHGGVLTSDVPNDPLPTVGVTAGIGAKLGEYRLGAFFLVGNPADPGVPTSGQLWTDRNRFDAIDDNRNRATQLSGLATLSFGYGFRSESNYRADNVLAIEALSGLSVGGTCGGEYSIRTSKPRGVVCSGSTRWRPGAFFGGRVGANYGIFSASLVAGARTVGPEIDPIATLGVGLALDD